MRAPPRQTPAGGRGGGPCTSEGISGQVEDKEPGGLQWRVRLGAGCFEPCRLRDRLGNPERGAGFGESAGEQGVTWSFLSFERITLLKCDG